MPMTGRTDLIVPTGDTLTRSHYAAARAWFQGMPPDAIASRWLAVDPEDVIEPRAAAAAMHAIRDALVRRATLLGRPDLADAVSAPARSGKGMDRAVDAVRELEQVGTPPPVLSHDVSLWFAGPLARRLHRAGVTTLTDLMDLCNARGRSWWRRVPRVGPRAAAGIVAFLQQHVDTLGQLGAHVTGQPLPAPIGHGVLQPGTGTAVPLEAIRLPRSLDGAQGSNRAPSARCVIEARDDYQAVQTWLSLWPTDSATRRAYRKEAERFLAWVIVERGKALSDALTDDCLAYRAFLRDPQPVARWCGPQVMRTVEVAGLRLNNPGWRPFTGPLSPRSARYAEKVLSSMFGWLVGRRYLDVNPWDGLPKLRHAGDHIDVDRAVAADVWAALVGWLECASQTEEPAGARMRTLRAAVLLLRDSGMRVFEVAAADSASLRPLAAKGIASSQPTQLWGELLITGKGGKERWVPISARAHAALLAHWLDRGEDLTNQVSGPLLAPIGEPVTPRAKAKAAAGRSGYSVRGLRHLVGRAAVLFRDHLAERDPELLSRAQRLNPHAFRHAFGTHATEADVPVDVLQSYMGHASPATTALYNKAGERRRQTEIGKLFADRRH